MRQVVPRACRWGAFAGPPALALALAGYALPAGAQDGAGVDVPEGCGSQAELHAELEALLGTRAATVERSAQLQISAQPDGTYALRVQLPDAVRELADTDCRALFAAAVVIIAVAQEPESARTSAAEPEPAPPVPVRKPPARATARPPRPPRPSLPEADADEEPAQPWQWRAALGGGAAAGRVDAVAPMLELEVGPQRGRFGLALALRYAFAQELMDTRSELGVSVFGAGGTLSGSFALVDWARLGAGVDLHALHGRGLGTTRPESDWVPAFGARAGMTFVPVRYGRLHLELGVFGLWTWLRPSFVIREYGEVSRVPRFGGEAVLRAGMLFL